MIMRYQSAALVDLNEWCFVAIAAWVYESYYNVNLNTINAIKHAWRDLNMQIFCFIQDKRGRVLEFEKQARRYK